MSMINQRGWVPENEDDPIWTENHYDKIKPFADALANEWSRIHHESEQRHFTEEFDREDGRNDYDFEDEAERSSYYTHKQLKHDLERVQVEVIEAKLHELGVRMMRPYEHHNEDEAYMEYAERDRY